MNLGIVFGIVFGGGLGIVFDNLIIFAGMGMAVGITIGIIIDSNKKKK